MRNKRPHDGRGHSFVGVPIAHCLVEGCTETRTWSQYPVSFGIRKRLDGGANWVDTQIGDDPYGVLEASLGRFADEGEPDPQGSPFGP